jgi:alkylhydroperoxidase family enzyme
MNMSITQALQKGGMSDEEIAAREAQLVSKPSRIPPIPHSEITDEQRAVIAKLNAAFGNFEPVGELGETTRLMLRNMDLFRCELDMVTQLLLRGKIPARERELIIVRTTWLCGSPNPFGEHVEMAKLCGITADELERLTREGSKAEGWSKHDRAILKATEDLLTTQTISDETWATLAETWNQEQLMEFSVVVGQYFASSVNHNALRTGLSAYNKGLRHR